MLFGDKPEVAKTKDETAGGCVGGRHRRLSSWTRLGLSGGLLVRTSRTYARLPFQGRDTSRGQGAFCEHYQMGEVLGLGKFSQVRRCVEKSSGKEWAVKVMRVGHAATSKGAEYSDGGDVQVSTDRCEDHSETTSWEEAKNELYIMSALQGQSGFGAVHELFEEQYPGCHSGIVTLYVVMELFEGGDLATALADRGSLAEEDARNVFGCLMSCCRTLQKLKIVHRDIKLDNIMLKTPHCFHKEVKLVDMGLATETFDQQGPRIIKETCGTPLYVAPEVVLTAHAKASGDEMSAGYCQDVDIWSCGVVLHMMLCGFAPFEAASLLDLYSQICSKRLAFSDPCWEMISPSAKDLVRRCLTKDPAKRITVDEALSHPWMAQI